MNANETIHIVDSSSRARAEQSRMVYEIGRHCEVYSDTSEFMIRPPERGIVLVNEDDEPGKAGHILRLLARYGRWLPFIATSHDPKADNIVTAIHDGVFDYLPLPLTASLLARSLDKIRDEVAAHGEVRRRVIEARKRISRLTTRESEVLDWLARGRSNKMIARELGISPRTVEIHRANMMAKIGANHSAQAVRFSIEAKLAAPTGALMARDAMSAVGEQQGSQSELRSDERMQASVGTAQSIPA